MLPPNQTYLAALVYLSVIGSVVGFTTYLMLVSRIGSQKAAYATVLFPVVALTLSSLYEDYHFTPLAMVGLALTLAGNAVMFARGCRDGSPSRRRAGGTQGLIAYPAPATGGADDFRVSDDFLRYEKRQSPISTLKVPMAYVLTGVSPLTGNDTAALARLAARLFRELRSRQICWCDLRISDLSCIATVWKRSTRTGSVAIETAEQQYRRFCVAWVGARRALHRPLRAAPGSPDRAATTARKAFGQQLGRHSVDTLFIVTSCNADFNAARWNVIW